MKRSFSFFLVLLMLLGILSGCSSTAADSGTSDTAAEIVSGIIDAALEDSDDSGSGSEDTAQAPAEESSESAEAGETEQAAEEESTEEAQPAEEAEETVLDENGSYDSKEEVALYIHIYGKLPSNYITKKQAESLGWSGGSLEKYAPGKCIGGSYFGNYEGLLPKASGREYHECDIDTLGASSRGAKRIVYSNDGLVYYTEDHYSTFELLYGEE